MTASVASASPQSPLLELRAITVTLAGEGGAGEAGAGEAGATTILDRVSLSLGHGEVLGVVGESGAGKSMTGAAVIGLLEPPLALTGGEILLDGQRIDTLPEREMRRVRGARIGMIFQDPLTSLNPVMTIGHQLVETIRQHSDRDRRAAREYAVTLLGDVGIPSPADRLSSYPHEFSGGMRQRVVIALALAGDPQLIIADEPTTALDVSIQAQIIALLKDVAAKRGAGVLIITHDLGVIAEIADRVAVMYAGRVVEVAPIEDILHRPAHPYTRALMGSIPTLGQRRETLPQIPGAMPRPSARPAGCAFHPRCAERLPRCAAERPELEAKRGGEVACWAV